MIFKTIILTFILTLLLVESNDQFEENTFVRSKRVAKRFGKSYPMPIPYQHSSAISAELLENIFDELRNQTCLDFVNDRIKKRGLSFSIAKKSRVSHIGPRRSKRTKIQIGQNCYESAGCIKHLLGLALGLYPEIQRHDRDNYIEILYENIKKSKHHYFEKAKLRDIWIRNTGFDYGSIMANNLTWKSKNGEPVFKSKLSKYYDNMLGQRYEFSFNDIKHLNDIYCGDVCKRRIKGCTNGGYVNPKNCRSCKCPGGFTGQQCTQIQKSKSHCGRRVIQATNALKDLILEGEKDCYIYIRSKRYTKIRIIVAEIKTKARSPCYKDMGLEIRYRHNKGTTGLCLCGHYKRYALNPFNSRVLIHYKGQSKNDRLRLRYQVFKNPV